MAAVFELPDMGPTHRLIMLALADHADDAGRCYPSLDRLAKRTGLSLRAVRSNLRQLEADGQIRTDPQGGPKGCNLYYVTPQPRQEMPPAGDAPGISRREPRQEMPPTPAGDAAEPSYNHQEPSFMPPKGGGPAFEDFWAKVPQKQDKALAKKAWSKISSADRKAATDAVADWYAWFKRVHLNATPTYPVNYLKHRKWEDEGWRPTASKQIQDRAAYWADQINAGRPISRYSVTPTLCEEMISRDLVSRDILKERGLG